LGFMLEYLIENIKDKVIRRKYNLDENIDKKT
jgi:hypothetical protein